MSGHKVVQRGFRSAAVRVHGHAGRFMDDEAEVVLIQHGGFLPYRLDTCFPVGEERQPQPVAPPLDTALAAQPRVQLQRHPGGLQQPQIYGCLLIGRPGNSPAGHGFQPLPAPGPGAAPLEAGAFSASCHSDFKA
ncbi:hypothetical protein D3C75_834750 [compost metagenome]